MLSWVEERERAVCGICHGCWLVWSHSKARAFVFFWLGQHFKLQAHRLQHACFSSLQAEKAAGLINTGAANEAKNHDAGAVKSDLERYELKSAAMIVNTKEPCFVTNYPEWTLRCTVRKSLAKAPSYFYLNLSGHNCIAILFLMSHMQGAEWWNIYIFFLVGVVTRSSARAWQNEGKKPIRLGKGKLLPKQKNPPWKTTVW